MVAAFVGFCLTHDLFNLFVWFEVVSVAAFALTGYGLRSSALEGVLNFTVVNTVGSYLILGGIGLIYARFGALDMITLGVSVAGAPNDRIVSASFVLMATGLLIKGAQTPFHFWLSDAHSVAPSPVSVIFSSSMVALGLFGLARVYFTVFSAAPAVAAVMHTLLTGFGAASTIIGAAMALSQRHLKRLLAFSTISHAGIMLIGLSLLSRGGIDEIGLRGMGAGIRRCPEVTRPDAWPGGPPCPSCIPMPAPPSATTRLRPWHPCCHGFPPCLRSPSPPSISHADGCRHG